MNNIEKWEKIEGTEHYYISDLGNVKSLFNGKEKDLKQRLDSAGYYRVNIPYVKKHKGYKIYKLYKTKRIHILVAEKFLNHTFKNYRKVINHKNGIKTDNRLENLEIISQKRNVRLGLEKCWDSTKNNNTFVGYFFSDRFNCFKVGIRVKERNYYLQSFETEKECIELCKLVINNLDMFSNIKSFKSLLNIS